MPTALGLCMLHCYNSLAAGRQAAWDAAVGSSQRLLAAVSFLISIPCSCRVTHMLSSLRYAVLRYVLLRSAAD